jgi:hypothetical protein
MRTFVTAASSNHFKSLCQLLTTIQHETVVVYDLGLTQSEVNHIRSVFRIEYRVFPFSSYPSFVSMSSPDAGAYAWKPILIAEVYAEIQGVLIWCDAGNKVFDADALEARVTKAGVYTPTSSGTISRWTHPTALNELSVPAAWSNLQMRNAACVGFNKDDRSSKFVAEWKKYALLKNASLPDGANRSNHRHDQSILTVLYYRHGITSCDEYVGVSIHNDIG